MAYEAVPQFEWDIHEGKNSLRIGVLKLTEKEKYVQGLGNFGRIYTFFPNSKTTLDLMELMKIVTSIVDGRNEMVVAFKHNPIENRWEIQTEAKPVIRGMSSIE